MGFVGREGALGEIERALSAVVAGGGPAVLRMSGEAGIGKTRLLTEIKLRAAGLGLVVLEGRAAEFDAGVPLAPVVDALDQHLSGAVRRVLTRLGTGVLADLAAVFPSLSAVADPAVVLTAERYRLHRAIRSLLAELAETTPVLLAIDDLHWADEATIELVLHLLEAPPPRVLAVVADRPAQVDARLPAAVARAKSEGRAVAIELGPLARSDAEQLVGEGVSAELLDRIYLESGGNPFFLTELARAEVSVPAGHDRDGEVPSSVRSVIAREIAALSAEARAFAAGGAVAGDPFDPDAAAVAAAIPSSRPMVLLDELLAVGLLVTTDQPRLFRFRHPIVRRAVYEQAGPGWRLAAHQRLADRLAADGASPLVAARHVAAVAKPGDEAAIDVLSSAAQLAQPSSPAAAAAWYGDAVRLVPATNWARRVELLTRTAAALRDGGQAAESREALVAALSLVPADDAQLRVEVTVQCAAVEHLLGMMDQAHARLHEALGMLGDNRSPLRATLLAELAVNSGWFRGDWVAAEGIAAEALETARDTGTRAIEALALLVLAFADYTAGRTDRARSALDRAAELVDRLGEDELSGHLSVVYYLARTEYFTDRTTPALRHADRGIAICHRTGQSPLLHLLLGVRSSALRNQGRFDEAAVAVEHCVDGARLSADPQGLLIALMDLLWLRTARGDLDSAITIADEALDLAAGLPPTMLNTTIAWGAAAAFLEAGHTDRAALLLLGPQGRASLDSAPLPGPILAWHLIARTLTRQGRLDEAQHWLDRIDESLPRVADMAAPQVWRATAAAELHLARGEPQQAARAVLAAADAADAAGFCYEASRARLLAGGALAATPDRDQAIALLEQSRAELEHYGAHRYHDQAIQELRRLGQRIGRGGRRGLGATGIEALSDRERQVAELAADGRTNKEIGDTLFLSTRTVERHLSHVFDKLGVESRSQLGAILAAGT